MNYARNEHVRLYWTSGKNVARLLSEAAVMLEALEPAHVNVSLDYDTADSTYTLNLYVSE